MKGVNRPPLPKHRAPTPRSAPWPLGAAALAGFLAGAILALLPALQGRGAVDWSAVAAQAAGSGIGFALVAALAAWVRNRMTGS